MELAVICSGREGRRRCHTSLCSFYPGPSPAFPGQSIFQTLLYPIPAASFLELPASLITGALNSPCLALSQWQRALCSLVASLCVSIQSAAVRAWAIVHHSLLPQLCNLGCNIQPPGSLLMGLSCLPLWQAEELGGCIPYLSKEPGVRGELEIALADTDTCAKQQGPALALVIAYCMAMSHPQPRSGGQHAASLPPAAWCGQDPPCSTWCCLLGKCCTPPPGRGAQSTGSEQQG